MDMEEATIKIPRSGRFEVGLTFLRTIVTRAQVEGRINTTAEDLEDFLASWNHSPRIISNMTLEEWSMFGPLGRVVFMEIQRLKLIEEDEELGPTVLGNVFIVAISLASMLIVIGNCLNIRGRGDFAIWISMAASSLLTIIIIYILWLIQIHRRIRIWYRKFR